MEIARTRDDLVLDVRDDTHTGQARRSAIALAEANGLSETLTANIGIVATELTTNLVRHASEGLFAMQWLSTAAGEGIQMLAIDRGSGMRDVGRCLQDGYSTRATPGNGLGAVKRLSSEFDIFSVPGEGTVVMSRILAGPRHSPVPRKRVCWSVFSRAAPRETVSGDIWRVHETAGRIDFMVCDGLGHGPTAALAAAAVADIFDRERSLSPAQFLEAAHRGTGHTRGAAVAAVRLDLRTGTLNFAGVGNVCGTLIHGEATKGMFSHNGTIGVQVRRIQAVDHEWRANGLLVMHTDGIQSRWSLADYPGLQSRDPAIIAAILARDFKRGHDDLTVLVARLGA